MKSMITFLSIAFLCLSCQKRAPMNLSLPPLEVLQKMEREQQAQQIEKTSFKFDGIEGGLISFQTKNGERVLNLNQACPIHAPVEGTLVFSCMNLSEKEALVDVEPLSVEKFDLRLKISKEVWESQYESFLYWPEDKTLIPLAEHEWRQGKNAFKSLFQTQKMNSDFYLVIRLKKYSKIGADQKFKTWENPSTIELSAFDYLWKKNEDTVVSFPLSFDREFIFPDISAGKTLEFNLSMKIKTPKISTAMFERVTVKAIGYEGEIIEGKCNQFNNNLSYEESSVPLNSKLADLHFRVALQGKQYDLMELMALGWGTVTLKNNQIKFQLNIANNEMGKGIKLYTYSYPPTEFTVGFQDFKNCNFYNKPFDYIKTVGKTEKVLAQSSEQYDGNYQIKDSF